MITPDEDSPLYGDLADPTEEAVTDETYGPLKAMCERAAVQRFGAPHTTVIRPTYVIGPWDKTDRFTYWVRRMERGGDVAVVFPGAPLQVIDGRDLGTFMVRCAVDTTPVRSTASDPTRRCRSCWPSWRRRASAIASSTSAAPRSRPPGSCCRCCRRRKCPRRSSPDRAPMLAPPASPRARSPTPSPTCAPGTPTAAPRPSSSAPPPDEERALLDLTRRRRSHLALFGHGVRFAQRCRVGDRSDRPDGSSTPGAI